MIKRNGKNQATKQENTAQAEEYATIDYIKTLKNRCDSYELQIRDLNKTIIDQEYKIKQLEQSLKDKEAEIAKIKMQSIRVQTDEGNNSDTKLFDDMLQQFQNDRSNFENISQRLQGKYDKQVTPQKNTNIKLNNLFKSRESRQENFLHLQSQSSQKRTEPDIFQGSRNFSIESRSSRPLLTVCDTNRNLEQTTSLQSERSETRLRSQNDLRSDENKKELGNSQLTELKKEYEYTQFMIKSIEQEVTQLQSELQELQEKSHRPSSSLYNGICQQIKHLEKRISAKMAKVEQLVKRALQLRKQIKQLSAENDKIDL